MALQTMLLSSHDGTKIYAEAIGNPSNPHVVFIHGFGLSTMVFSRQFTDQRLLENLYMVGYDMRGHGRSGKPENLEAYVPARTAEDFLTVMEEFSLNRPFLVGWSIGATIAADICAVYGPSLLSGIVYMGAQPFLSREMQEKVGTVTVRELIRGFLTNDLALSSRTTLRFLDTCLDDPTKLAFETRVSWLGCVALQSPTVRRCVLTRVQDATRLFQEGGKVLPLLILHGATDDHSQGDVLIEEMKAVFIDFEGKLIPKAGHAVFWEQPDIVREELLRFVARVAK